MKARTRLVAFVAAIFLALSLTARTAFAVVSPNGSYLLDRTGLISEKTKDYITERNYNLEKNCSGAQICVVVLSTIGSDDITDYARDVFEKWKIGDSEEDNGVLLLMLTEDKDYVIIPGQGLEKLLTPGVLTDVNRNCCEPYFADGDYDTAVRETVRKLNEHICRSYGADPSGYAGGSGFNGGGSGRPGSGSSFFSGSCRKIGGLSLAACGACIGYELLSSQGGDD